MKKTTKRLGLRREVLQHLQLQAVHGGTITATTNPNLSCGTCYTYNDVCKIRLTNLHCL